MRTLHPWSERNHVEVGREAVLTALKYQGTLTWGQVRKALRDGHPDDLINQLLKDGIIVQCSKAPASFRLAEKEEAV
jgi:hypothetical protein